MPSLNYKRILLGILLIVISLALLYGIIWLIFLRSPTGVEEEPTTGVVGPSGELPGTGEGEGILVGSRGNLPGSENINGSGGIERGTGGEMEASEIARGSLTKVRSLIDEDVNQISLGSNGFNYLSGEDNKFYRLLPDGSKFLLADKDFPYVDNAVWSKDNNRVILEYPDGANIVFDFTKNRATTLPEGLEGAGFDNSSNNIAYKFIGANQDENWLVVSDVNNTQAEAIEPIGTKGSQVQVNWSPNNQIVALYREASGLNSEEVFFIGLHDENFRSLKVQGSNFEGMWSPQGDRILYHTIVADNDYNPVLWVADATMENMGSNNFNLGLSTWVDKCVFASAVKVYCAVPVGLPQGAGLYPDLVNDRPDVFYEINLASGISKLIALPVLSEDVNEFQVKKLFISSTGRELYFLDNWTRKIYTLRLQ